MKKKILLFIVLSVAMCLLLTGCGNKDEEKKSDKKSNDAEPTAVTTSTASDEGNETLLNGGNSEDTNNTTSDINLYSDDTKLVFETAQGKMVYYYSGEKITSAFLYIDYQDNATAQIAAQALKQEDEDDEIKNVTTDGKYVIVEYESSEFDDISVSELKLAMQYYQQLGQ